jgi:hypothetical protein
VDEGPQVIERGLDHVRAAPTGEGTLDLIVCRPAVDQRTVLETGLLDLDHGLIGDSWRVRGSSTTLDGSANPDAQLNIMGARAAALIAGPVDRWSLAGDQLFVDFDLSELGAPAGTRLSIGEAVIELTAKPHRGCKKFSARFGLDALRLVNSPAGVELNLRGRCARVVVPGRIRTGDRVARVPSADGAHTAYRGGP